MLLPAAPLGAEGGTGPELGLRDYTPGLRAFTDATVVVAPGRKVEDATLVIDDGRVVAVGAGLPVPEGAREVDLAGKTVYPGFLDPYTDYGLSKVEPIEAAPEGRGGGRRSRGEPRYEARKVGPAAWNDAIQAQHDWVEAFEPDPEAAEKLLERGVTAVQSARMDGVFRGRAFVASLAQGAPNEAVIEPRALHFVAFDKGSSQQSYPSSLMGSIALVRQTLHDARWYQRARRAHEADPSLRAPEVDLALSALAGYDGPLVVDSGDDLSLLRAARLAEELSQPVIHVGSQGEYRRIDEVAALGQPIILPLSLPPRPEVATREAQLDVSLAELRHWERAPFNPAALAAAGVDFAFTGHGLDEGEDFLDNLRATLERGLTPEAALAALTTVPARLLGLEDELGSLEPGKRAHFSIADGDLLADEDARLFEVWIDGERAKSFRDLEEADFRGSYRLTLEGRRYRLEVRERRAGRLAGKLEAGGEEARARDLEAEGERLTFHADLAPLGGPGVVHLRLRQRPGGTLEGEATLADGRRLDLEVERTGGPETAGEDDGEEEGPDPKVLVSRLTYPNVAYGYEHLPQAEDVLVRGATVWTLEDEGVLEEADLLVQGGKVAAVGRGLEPPAGARVIDAHGKHVTPGIIDEHSHLAISGGVNEGSHAVTSEVRIGDVVDADDVGIYRALAGGVTAAQLLHGSANPIGGQAQVIKMRWGRGPEALKFAAAPPSIKFALGENVKQSNWGDAFTVRYPQTRMGVETLMRDAFLAARRYGEEHAAWEALPAVEKEKKTPPRRDFQLEALLEILRGERIVHVHSYVQSEILALLRLAEELGFRIGTYTHILEGYKVAPEMAAHGAGGSTFSDWWAYKFEVYDAIPQNACLMHAAGVVTSINSDSAEMIRRLNQEAAKSVMYCGMSELEALAMVTLSPARQLGVDDRVGSLAAGKDADFVIWDGHPLSVLSKVEETWVDGALTFSRERDLELRAEVAEEKRALIEKVLETPEEESWGGNGGGYPQGRRLWHCDDVEDYWHAR